MVVLMTKLIKQGQTLELESKDIFVNLTKNILKQQSRCNALDRKNTIT